MRVFRLWGVAAGGKRDPWVSRGWTPLVQAATKTQRSLQRSTDLAAKTISYRVYDTVMMHTCLEASARGPTGDADSSKGELPVSTSLSKLFDSFLSNPASLPVKRAARSCKHVPDGHV